MGSDKTRKVSQGPPFFSSFGKQAKDLTEAGYSKDRRLKFSTRKTGVTLTSNAAGCGRLSADVAGQYIYKDAKINVQFNANSSPVSTTLTFSRNFLPSWNTTASLKLPDFNSSKEEFQLALFKNRKKENLFANRG